jgi:predicted nucleic acid-binding protein
MGIQAAHAVMEALDLCPDVYFIRKYYYWDLIKNDPDDNKFVDCAIAANADYIVTNDRDFKILSRTPFPKVQVLTADAFLKMLQ